MGEPGADGGIPDQGAEDFSVVAAHQEEGEPVASGNSSQKDRIVMAIAAAERGTTGEIRVHLSKRWIERNSMKRARRLFARFGMSQTPDRNAVLLYVNLRRRKLAVIGDLGIHSRVGERFWNQLASGLRADLRATHPENAIAIAVAKVGQELCRYFPLPPGAKRTHAPPDEVTQD